jgi:hypothetical protein
MLVNVNTACPLGVSVLKYTLNSTSIEGSTGYSWEADQPIAASNPANHPVHRFWSLEQDRFTRRAVHLSG